MSRIVAPMVGGMITAPLLSMLVIPAAYRLMLLARERRQARWNGRRGIRAKPSPSAGGEPMYTHTFTVEDMSCGACVSAIERAVLARDPAALVLVDLAGRRVQIDSAEPAEAFAEALREAGYTPVPA